MSEYHFSAPVAEEEIRKLRVGDIIYYDGIIVTGRDAVHDRVVNGGISFPVDARGGALYHAGPIVKKRGEGYELVAAGPTTSMRMEKCEREFIEKTGVRIIIGKGGMGNNTADACREFGAVHAVFPGGCAVLAANHVEEVLGVEWDDLGMPEAVWVLRVKDFGPLVVSIDSCGGNMFESRKKATETKRDLALEKFFGITDR
ncbi:MAG: L(+)-tartrate dehydratase subunit beta [Clostridia bacterium]|nr:L(+)-tartrate dehydratase subunit beta [Clostridia bacterium]